MARHFANQDDAPRSTVLSVTRRMTLRLAPWSFK